MTPSFAGSFILVSSGASTSTEADPEGPEEVEEEVRSQVTGSFFVSNRKNSLAPKDSFVFIGRNKHSKEKH